MKLRGRAGLRTVAPVAIGLLLLSGCGELRPGTAAVINGTKITNSQVSDLANAQCVAADRAAKSGSSTTNAISKVKQQSLGLLMDTELSKQFGKDQKITAPKGISQGFYGQFEPGITPLPGKARTVLAKVFKDWSVGRAILVQAGSESSGQAVSYTNVEQLMNAGLKDRDSWLKKAKITTDPRYGPTKDGYPGAAGGSVSRADSAFAKSASATKTDPKWVSGLPADQRCG